MLYIFFSAFISFIACLTIVRLNFAHDTYQGPQKFHEGPTPRIGGVAIFVAFLLTGLLLFFEDWSYTVGFLLMTGSALPVFVSGVVEDVTKRVSPKWRLIASIISGLCFLIAFDSSINKVGVPLVDTILSMPFVSIVFTTFAIAGVSHAFNIIDGFNGLAAGVAILVFGAYAYVSFLNNDPFLVYLSLVSLAATLGFFLWNYPFGYIFLGDGGAYLLGFLSASIGVLLVNRHPEVSPWFPFLLVLYPVWETLFSIYRKKFIRGIPPSLPDSVHFHMLIYKRITKSFVDRNLSKLERNYMTSPFLWVMELLCFVPAVLFWKNTPLLMLFSICFVLFYTWLYFRIVKFRTPRILRLRL